jgi:OmpA-OmpF porin, OOP family
MRTMASAIVTALATAALPLSAQSADRGFYAGLSAHYVDPENLPQYMGVYNEDDREIGFKVVAGYQFFEWLAVEAGYADLGSEAGDLAVACIPEEICGGHITQKSNAFSVSALGLWGVGPVDLFARAGLARWNAEATYIYGLDTILRRKDHGEKLTFGVGAGWRLGAVTLRLECEQQPVADRDFRIFSIGATWHFGD